MEGAEVTRSGRVSQTRAAATGKARSPTVGSRVRLTINDKEELERSQWRASTSATWQSLSVRYAGADRVYRINTESNIHRCVYISEPSQQTSKACWEYACCFIHPIHRLALIRQVSYDMSITTNTQLQRIKQSAVYIEYLVYGLRNAIRTVTNVTNNTWNIHRSTNSSTVQLAMESVQMLKIEMFITVSSSTD